MSKKKSNKRGNTTQIKANDHHFKHWRWLVANGRVRKGISYPRRERVLVRNALSRIGVRYRELIPFYNPHHSVIDRHVGGIQWLDFTLFHKRLIVLLFDPYYSTGYGAQRAVQSLEDKKRFLNEKGVPCLELGRFMTSQEYEITIRLFLRKVSAYEKNISRRD